MCNAFCIKFIALSLVLLTMTGCSLDKMLVRASTPMIEGGVEALNHETDLELAEDSIPANLNMLQGVIKIDPKTLYCRPMRRRHIMACLTGSMKIIDQNAQRIFSYAADNMVWLHSNLIVA